MHIEPAGKLLRQLLRGKYNFAEVSKNLTRYRSENNFVYGPSK